MDFLEFAKTRSSVRKYTAEKIDEASIARVLEAGRIAPTAANIQSERFIVVDSEDGLAKLALGCNPHGAPLAVIVCGDHENVWKRPYDKKDMVDIDTTIVTTYLMLEAESLGLGSCWLTYFDPVVLRREFSIPEGIEAVSILVIGHPASAPRPVDRYDSERTPLADLVHRNRY